MAMEYAETNSVWRTESRKVGVGNTAAGNVLATAGVVGQRSLKIVTIMLMVLSRISIADTVMTVGKKPFPRSRTSLTMRILKPGSSRSDFCRAHR